MPYPRHLNLGSDSESKLASWFETELINHLAERSPWIEQLARYQSDYNAEPSTKVATFPFQGASTIIVPLTAIAFEATYSRTAQTLYALDQKTFVKAFSPDKDVIEPALERLLDQTLFLDMDFKKKTEPAVLELHKLGTGVGKADYADIRKKGVRYNRQQEEEEFEVIVHQGPMVDSVPLANFLMPFENEDPQTSRWCGEVFWLTPNEVLQRERDGFFKKGFYDELKQYYCDPSTSDNPSTSVYRSGMEHQQNRVPVWPKRLEFYQIYTAWDFDNETYDQEICFVWHRQSRQFGAIWYNWFWDYRRPYRKGNYFPLEFRWAGIGIGKQNEMFQQEMTSIHRQRLDNGTIANLRMFKVNRNADIKPDEPLFPGKLWFLDDMNDVQPLEMGDVKVSAYNNENSIMLLSQQRTGVNELTLGMPQMGTPGTATDSAARVQESARKFDFTFNNTRTFLDELITDTLCNMAQWGPNAKRIELLENGTKVELFLKQDYELFRKQLLCKVGLVGQNQNKLLDRQNMTQLSGVIKQYYTDLLTMAQQRQDQQLIAAITDQAFVAANETLLQILQTWDIRNPEKLLFKREMISNVQQPLPIGQGGPQAPAPNNNFSSTSILAPNLASVLPQGTSQPGFG
jgi:hypothetical protein